MKSKKRKFYQTKEFINLQSKWYSKLEDSGFKDLEWSKSAKYSNSQDSPHLVEPHRRIRDKLTPEQLLHFLSVKNFLTHYPFALKRHKILIKLYSEGKSLRQIAEIIGKNKHFYLNPPSHYKIYTLLKFFLGEMARFNHEHPEGICFGASQDSLDFEVQTINSTINIDPELITLERERRSSELTKPEKLRKPTKPFRRRIPKERTRVKTQAPNPPSYRGASNRKKISKVSRARGEAPEEKKKKKI